MFIVYSCMFASCHLKLPNEDLFYFCFFHSIGLNVFKTRLIEQQWTKILFACMCSKSNMNAFH